MRSTRHVAVCVVSLGLLVARAPLVALPVEGATQIFDNARATAWDVVVVYLADGVLASTSLDGQVVNNQHYAGFTKFNPRDRTHTETLVQGEGRAIIVELK